MTNIFKLLDHGTLNLQVLFKFTVLKYTAITVVILLVLTASTENLRDFALTDTNEKEQLLSSITAAPTMNVIVREGIATHF